jgi:hypothetical protein
MAVYRFLVDHSIGQFYYPAGTIASTADSGGTLPANWSPSPNVDPQDTDALNAYYAAGVSSIEFREASYSFNNSSTAPTMWRSVRAVTYFLPTAQGRTMSWTLTGLGVGLGAVCS